MVVTVRMSGGSVGHSTALGVAAAVAVTVVRRWYRSVAVTVVHGVGIYRGGGGGIWNGGETRRQVKWYGRV